MIDRIGKGIGQIGVNRAQTERSAATGKAGAVGAAGQASAPAALLSEIASAGPPVDADKIAAIPLSAFFADGRDERVIRFCFAKNEATLAAACERLRRV